MIEQLERNLNTLSSLYENAIERENQISIREQEVRDQKMKLL